MGFEIFAQAFHEGGAATADVDAMRRVLTPFLSTAGGGLVLRASDGSECEVYGLDSDERSGCMFARPESGVVMDLIVQAAQAGNCVLFWPSDTLKFAITSPAQRQHVPGGAAVFECNSGSELNALIAADR